ncbi:hypothetical protein BHE74_00002976 [Ensete ventricosum]|nr:hypothetical protein GW17_00000455 [Ensete ventricosum]RWW88160.1 hypothetical protein BHE74_00002976 [Ensete ventricosum]
MTDGLTSRAPPHTPSTPATAEGVGSSVSVHVPRKEASGSHTSCETPFTIYRPSRRGNQPINIPVDPALHRREVDETLLGDLNKEADSLAFRSSWMPAADTK